MQVIEGLWDEVRERDAELRGKRVRVVVLEQEPLGSPIEQRLQRLREMFAHFQQRPPAGSVADEQLRRENLYDETSWLAAHSDLQHGGLRAV
ncbi:MAG: hypothetical protein NZM28_10390 [Fimbriimonadales bacterium]|nr:hypothetical protein [Fimbriimonadales bacterium]